MTRHTHYAAPGKSASDTETHHPPVFSVTVTEFWTAIKETHCIIHCLAILRIVHIDVSSVGFAPLSG
jgi:hypothetical protein